MPAEWTTERTHTDGLAIAALVTGGLAVFGSVLGIGVLLGPAALAMGLVSRALIARSEGRMTGGRIALAGLLLGVAGAVLSLFLPAALFLMTARVA